MNLRPSGYELNSGYHPRAFKRSSWPAERQSATQKWRVRSLQNQAEAVSKTLGFDASRIDFVKGTREFDVNGVKHTAAGDADIYKGDAGRIRLYTDHIYGSEALAGITAHEIEHFKYQSALDGYRKDLEALAKEEGPPPDPNQKYGGARRADGGRAARGAELRRWQHGAGREGARDDARDLDRLSALRGHTNFRQYCH